MKSHWLSLTLALSLATNLTVWALLHHSGEVRNNASGIEHRSESATSPSDPKAAWQLLYRDDLSSLTQTLRDAGAPENLLRSFVHAAIEERYVEREAVIRSSRATKSRWWEITPEPPIKAQLALAALLREKAELEQSLLGPPEERNDGLFDNLPAEKRATARIITEAYEAMIRATRGPVVALRMPSEREEIKRLEGLRDQELLAFLSPTELEEYKLRTSQTTATLRHRWGNFECTEEEYKKIYAIEKAVYDTGRLSPDDERRMERQFNEQLGEKRGTEVARSLDSGYGNLRQMVATSGLPESTADQVYDLRDATSSESKKIAARSDLSQEEKQKAFSALAAKAREGFSTALGPTAGPAYLKGAEHWLGEMEKGRLVTFYGSSWHSENVE